MIDVGKQEHYTALSPEPIEVIRSWKLGFNLGNVVKYIGRCELKGDKLLDLKKAKQYLEWEIEELGGKAEPGKSYVKRAHSQVKERRPLCYSYGSKLWDAQPQYADGPADPAVKQLVRDLGAQGFHDYYVLRS